MAQSHMPALEVSREDDARVAKAAATEDYSLHVMPPSWRAPATSISMAWFALFSAMFWLVVAATVSLAVGTIDTLIGIGLSCVAYGLINYALSRYSIRTGLTVALFSRALFGYAGASLAAVLFAATAIYYAVFEGSVVAVALHEYVGGMSLKLWYLIVVLYSMPLVIGGVRVWLDKFNGYLLPFYVIGLIVAVIWAIVDFGYSNDWLTYEPATPVSVGGPGWLFAFSVYMGVWIMMMYTFDYARFGKPKDAKILGWVSFGPVFYIGTLLVNGAIGCFLAHTIKVQGGISEISVVLGIVEMMGIVGVALIWVSQTRINTANFYLSSSNLQSVLARVFKIRTTRTVCVLIVGIVVYLVMLTDVFSFILSALRYQGIVIVAWVGVAITHVGWEAWKGIEPRRLEFRPGRVPLFNPAGLIAWSVATGVGLALLLVKSWQPFGGTWGPPLAFVTAIGCYLAGLQIARRSWYVMERPYDPRSEVDDVWDARVRCHECGLSYVAFEMDRDPGTGHAAICAECASESPTFYHAARQEARLRSAGGGRRGGGSGHPEDDPREAVNAG